MAREASLEELLKSSFQSQLVNQWTAIPCIVVSVRDSLNGQMVDIQPTINQKQKDGTVKERSVILGVPVSFQVSKKAGLTFPIEVGDTGTAIFSMRSMDVWKGSNGLPSTPNNNAKMDKSDAIFFPGIQPPNSAVNNPAKHVLTHSTQDTTLFNNLGGVEQELRLKKDGSIEITTSNQPVTINCSVANVIATEEINLSAPVMNVDVQLSTFNGNIAVNGNITHLGNYQQTGTYVLTGLATLNGIPFDTHRHTGVTTGLGTSGGPVP